MADAHGNNMEHGKYKIVGHGSYATYVIKPNGKGSIPVKLAGMYTSIGEAKNAIDKHERLKGKANGKTTTSGGVQ